MKHKDKILIGAVFGGVYWIIVNLGVIGYGHNRFDNNRTCVHSSIRVSAGDDSLVGDNKVNYANTVFYEIKAEQSLREDAVGLYGQTSYIGQASFYGEAFAGNTTACGDIFSPRDFTAASLRHDCGTRLAICGTDTFRCVGVVVNDTGAFEALGRVIDLSEAAFEKIAPLSAGVVRVEITEEKQ